MKFYVNLQEKSSCNGENGLFLAKKSGSGSNFEPENAKNLENYIENSIKARFSMYFGKNLLVEANIYAYFIGKGAQP